MKKVNLRDLYPDVYKNDYFVEVTEDVLETIRAAERTEAAYDRRMYRYKAYYSLDCDNGIENAILMKPQTPEMLLEEKQFQEQVYAAVMKLPEKQAKRIYARYYLYQNIHAVGVLFQHPTDAAHLPFNAVQPVKQGFVFLRAALFVTAAAGDSSICRSVRFWRVNVAATVLFGLFHIGIAPFINPHGVYFLATAV